MLDAWQLWCAVLSAVADVQPAATEAAKVAKSAATADLIAMVSPAVTVVLAVSESFVWFPMFVNPFIKRLNCAAVTVSAFVTAAISVCPSPYTVAPVPAKWLYPKGELELVTKVL